MEARSERCRCVLPISSLQLTATPLKKFRKSDKSRPPTGSYIQFEVGNLCQDIPRDQKGLRSGSWGGAVLLFNPQTTRPRGGSLGHHLVGEAEEWLFNAYFIGSEEEEEEVVSSKGWI